MHDPEKALKAVPSFVELLSQVKSAFDPSGHDLIQDNLLVSHVPFRGILVGMTVIFVSIDVLDEELLVLHAHALAWLDDAPSLLVSSLQSKSGSVPLTHKAAHNDLSLVQ